VKSIAFPNTLFPDLPAESKLILERRRWTIALTASASSSAVTGLVGLVLAAASLLRFVPHEGRASLFGTVLLAATFPLMIVAAHCLDKMDEANVAIRRANFVSQDKDI